MTTPQFNGNVISVTATVTRTNGSTTTASTVGVTTDTTAANVNLASNPFYREFTTPSALTTAALALPEMLRSGWMRDLRETMRTAKRGALEHCVNDDVHVKRHRAQANSSTRIV